MWGKVHLSDGSRASVWLHSATLNSFLPSHTCALGLRSPQLPQQTMGCLCMKMYSSKVCVNS